MLNTIKNELQPYYHSLHTHSLYQMLDTKQGVETFMEHHIYCVWDFMNLLKALQSHFTCTTIPWKPTHSPKLSRLINEIVLEEESDIIEDKETSHFMYYHHALETINPSIDHVSSFIAALQSKKDYHTIITQPFIPKASQTFLKTTYALTHSSILEIAAAFTFGREALVPSLFEPIVSTLKQQQNSLLDPFISYLERHIELDGDHHAGLAYEMITLLATTNDQWDLVKKTAINVLNARHTFWNDVTYLIQQKQA